MSLVIPLAHDPICPWCWIAWHQVKGLRKEFDVEFDWLAYELMPEELPWGDPKPKEPTPRPPTPSRFSLALLASSVELPKIDRPKKMRSHNVLEGLEYAKAEGKFEALNDAIYPAWWMEGKEINNLDVLCGLAEGIVADLDDFRRAVEEKRFVDRIVPFDDKAHEDGIWNVPTYRIGGERLAEQPTSVVREALRKELG